MEKKEVSSFFFLVRSELKKKKDIINKSCGHNQKAPKCVTVVQLWLIFGIWMYISTKQEMQKPAEDGRSHVLSLAAGFPQTVNGFNPLIELASSIQGKQKKKKEGERGRVCCARGFSFFPILLIPIPIRKKKKRKEERVPEAPEYKCVLTVHLEHAFRKG